MLFRSAEKRHREETECESGTEGNPAGEAGPPAGQIGDPHGSQRCQRRHQQHRADARGTDLGTTGRHQLDVAEPEPFASPDPPVDGADEPEQPTAKDRSGDSRRNVADKPPPKETKGQKRPDESIRQQLAAEIDHDERGQDQIGRAHV